MRSGTLAVPQIVGFGKACELCEQEMAAKSARLSKMGDHLQAGIMKALEEVYLNGHPTQRLPHNLNISFAYVEGESLLMGLKETPCPPARPAPRHAGAVRRAAGAGRRIGAGPLVHPVRTGAVQHERAG